MNVLARAALVAAAAIPSVAFAQDNALIGVTRAVDVAESTLSGRAVEAELETKNGRLVYEVDVVRNGSLHEAQVDARTGKLLSTNERRIESMWRSWFDPARLKPSGPALGKTLAKLETETGGRVQEVGFDSEGSRTYYDVEIATSAGVADILIDPVTGKRLPPGFDD